MPLFFSRGCEEVEYLAKQHIRAEIVLGITTASGVMAYAEIPLTIEVIHRGTVYYRTYQARWRLSVLVISGTDKSHSGAL
ncbi:SAM-dependent methyltransferase [Psychromonas sp. PT13]|uniref:SAM-dependent methyltransferase n=1 Tax=Psychromonas sp. PT13 TaxID=3439547 RepID=UPI003EB733C2